MIKLRPPSGFWKPEHSQSPVFLPTAIPLEAVPSPPVESGPEILTKWLSLRKSGSNTPRVLNVGRKFFQSLFVVLQMQFEAAWVSWALNTISEPRRSASGATRDGLLYL